MYRSGVICDGESSRNVLWRPAKYSSAANRTEKLVAAFTVTLSGSRASAQGRGVGSGTALRWL